MPQSDSPGKHGLNDRATQSGERERGYNLPLAAHLHGQEYPTEPNDAPREHDPTTQVRAVREQQHRTRGPVDSRRERNQRRDSDQDGIELATADEVGHWIRQDDDQRCDG